MWHKTNVVLCRKIEKDRKTKIETERIEGGVRAVDGSN